MTTLTRSLRVMSWNIHKGIGGLDRRYDLDRVLAVIQHYEPDVLLLQEVAQAIPRLRSEDQVALLTKATGHHAAFAPEHQFSIGGYGNLILSRFPLSDVRHLDLTVGWRKRRGVLQVHARIPFGEHHRSLVLHNFHLGLAGSERGVQLLRFLESEMFRRLQQATPMLVGGDLNDLWGSLGPRFLAPAGLTRAGTLAATFPSVLPLRPLDGLFYRGDLVAQRCEVARLRLAVAASDHRPLVADFELFMDASS
jgi:endonuclease/exonuclease/phosphatase family metal-dependent hydrolase